MRLFVLLVVITLLALPVLTYPLGRDQGEFATIGRGVLDGRVPYTELWNPKPPAVFYVYAAAIALLGETTAALRALDLVLVWLVAVGLVALASAWTPAHPDDAGGAGNDHAGGWAALVFAAFYLSESFWTLTQNDGIALAPMVWALVCAVRAADSTTPRRAVWALGAGVLSAITVWFKYPFALFVPVVVVAYGLARRGAGLPAQSAAANRRVVAAFVVGAALPVVGGVTYLAAQGALAAFIESAQETSEYTALGFNLTDLGAALVNYGAYRLHQWGALFALAALGVVVARRTGGRADPASGSARINAVVVVLGWLGAATAIMLVQAKAYDYHWLPMLPPLALLGGRALAWATNQPQAALTRRLVTTGAGAGLLALIALNTWGTALPYLTGQADERDYAARFVAGDFRADETDAVVAYLRERTTRGDSLFIWGFRPEVYYESGLRPATRWIFQFPLVGAWYPAAWRAENVEVLWAALPPYVLVVQTDNMPWVTGRDADSNTLLQEYTELNNWLIYNYERETQIGSFFVWRRKPTPTS